MATTTVLRGGGASGGDGDVREASGRGRGGGERWMEAVEAKERGRRAVWPSLERIIVFSLFYYSLLSAGESYCRWARGGSWRCGGGWKAEGEVRGFVWRSGLSVLGFCDLCCGVFEVDVRAWVLRLLGCVMGCLEERMGGGERGQRGSGGQVSGLVSCLPSL